MLQIIVDMFLLLILIIAILALFLCVYGIFYSVYIEYILPIIRKKKGGVWYYVQYLDNIDSIHSVINPIKEWTQCDKPKGYYFEILKTETYEKDN